jgi:hypothetical protein
MRSARFAGACTIPRTLRRIPPEARQTSIARARMQPQMRLMQNPVQKLIDLSP